MRSILTLALKDLRVMTRDWFGMFWIVVFPIWADDLNVRITPKPTLLLIAASRIIKSSRRAVTLDAQLVTLRCRCAASTSQRHQKPSRAMLAKRE